MDRDRQKTLLRAAAKVALLLVVAWGLRRTITGALDQLAEQHWSAGSIRWPWMILAGVLYLAGLGLVGLFWRRILAALGQPASTLVTLRAYYIGHLGKYIPGKAIVILLRAGLLGEGVNLTVAAASVLIETLTMMALGALVGGAALAVVRPDAWLYYLAAFAVGTGLLVPTMPFALRGALRWLGKLDAAAAECAHGVTWRTLIPGWLAIVATWVLAGASLYATLYGAGYTPRGAPLEMLLVCMASAGLAVVLGFLSFIPGGFFVREALLLELLSPHMNEGQALVAAVLLRLVWLVSELVVSIMLYGFGPRFARLRIPRREKAAIESPVVKGDPL